MWQFVYMIRLVWSTTTLVCAAVFVLTHPAPAQVVPPQAPAAVFAVSAP